MTNRPRRISFRQNIKQRPSLDGQHAATQKKTFRRPLRVSQLHRKKKRPNPPLLFRFQFPFLFVAGPIQI